MAESPATTLPPVVGELERRLGLTEGTLEDADKARAEDALDDATELALAEVNRSKAALWREVCPKVVRLVILKAARREVENPMGLTQESVLDHSATIAESSGVFFTGRELALIRREATGRSGSFVGSVRTPSAYHRRPEAPC